MSSDVITEAKIPTKAFYYINENHEVEGITIEEGSLPESLGSNHVGNYYYDEGEKLYYLIVETDNGIEAEKINIEKGQREENQVGKYYYTYEGEEVFSIGVSSFDRIWGVITDSEDQPITDDNGNPITINLQDAMNALYKMMTSRSHVWAGTVNDKTEIPDYAKLLIQTSGNFGNNS